MNRFRTIAGPLVGLTLFVAAIAGVAIVKGHPASSLQRSFSLISSSSGAEVTERDFGGKWLLVFFGYTSCPDVCPTTLSNIAQAMSDLGPVASRVQPLFITVDPARDTTKVLSAYTAAFDMRIVGLTGTSAQIASVAQEFGARYWTRNLGAGDYSVDHTATVYVVDPHGLFVTTFLTTSSPTDMAGELRRLAGLR